MTPEPGSDESRTTCHHGRRASRRDPPRPVVAAFDVDGTVTNGDCVVPFLRRVAGTPRIAGGLLRRCVPFLAALARRDRDRVKALASHAAFAGRPISDIEQHGVGLRRRDRRPAPPARHGRPDRVAPRSRPHDGVRVGVATACTCARWPPASAWTTSWRPSWRSRPTVAAPAVSSTATAAGPPRSPACTPGSTSTTAAGRRSSCGPTATRGRPRAARRRRSSRVGQGRRRDRRRPRGPRDGGGRRARPHRPAATVAEERPRLRRARCGRGPRPVGRPVAHAARVRRVLPRGELDLPVERRPRRGGRPHPPDEAPAARRVGDRARPHGQDRRLAPADRRARRRRADRALADRRRRRGVPRRADVVQPVVEARRRARHRDRRVRLRAARRRVARSPSTSRCRTGSCSSRCSGRCSS